MSSALLIQTVPMIRTPTDVSPGSVYADLQEANAQQHQESLFVRRARLLAQLQHLRRELVLFAP